MQNRFQEFAPDYAKGDKETDLVPVESINKVPIAMNVGTWDEVCPHSQAVNYKKILGDIVVDFKEYGEKDHGFWAYANDENFMQNLVAQLQPPTDLKQEFLSWISQMILV